MVEKKQLHRVNENAILLSLDGDLLSHSELSESKNNCLERTIRTQPNSHVCVFVLCTLSEIYWPNRKCASWTDRPEQKNTHATERRRVHMQHCARINTVNRILHMQCAGALLHILSTSVRYAFNLSNIKNHVHAHTSHTLLHKTRQNLHYKHTHKSASYTR